MGKIGMATTDGNFYGETEDPEKDVHCDIAWKFSSHTPLKGKSENAVSKDRNNDLYSSCG